MYGKVKTTLANTAYTFVGDNNGSYTINTSDNILNVPSGVTVTDNNGTKYVGPGEFKFNNDIDKTISLNTNATISTEKSVVVASDDDTKVKVIKDEGNNIVELVDGKANVKGETKTNLNGDYVFESVDNKEYTIDKASNKLTVLSNVTVKDDKGVIYKGEGSFIFNADTTIKVIDDATITSKEGGNGSSVTGTGNTTIKVDAGNVTLIGGKGKSTGKMFVKFKNTNLDVQSFNSDGASYTVDTSDTDSSITLNSGTEETKVSLELGDKIKLIGKENDKFILDSNDSKTTISIPNKARITGNANSTIEGDTDTSVEIDNEGNLALVSGRANLIGLTSIDIKYDSTKTVKVTAPINTVVNVDTANKKVTLSKDKSVRIGNVIYTASVDNSSFDLEDKKLTNDKDMATVLGNINEEVTISLDTLNITLPSTNSGDVSITKDSPLSIIKLSKKDDKFTINGTAYTSGSDDTTFSVDTDGNVKLVNGSVLLKKDESITGVGDKEITNNSDDVLTVTSDDTKDIILIPLKEGKLKIGDTEYVTDSDNTKVSVDKNGNVKLVSGSVVLEDEQSIIGINSNKLIRNPGVSKLIVAIDDLKDVVTILNKDNKVKIDDSEYKSASDNTKIEMTVEFNKLISGSIKLEKDKSITGSSGKLITNIGDSVIVVSSDGTNDTITVPSSGKVKIDDETYKASGDTTILIKDGGIKVIGGNLKKNVVNTATGISANSNIFNYFLLMLVSIFVIIKLTKFGK